MMPRRNSSLLELEAADYFKLDPNHINLLAVRKPANRHQTSGGNAQNSCGFNFVGSDQVPNKSQSSESKKPLTKPAHTGGQRMTPKRQAFSHQRGRFMGSRTIYDTTAASRSMSKSPLNEKNSRCAGGSRTPPGLLHGRRSSNVLEARANDHYRGSQRQYQMMNNNHQHPVIISPSASTNSLPSVSSSPSVSPSLVCPHLSLDDILSGDGRMSRSPHTIGLCARCRLDPPPDIHSPLSPTFKPSRTSKFSDRDADTKGASTPSLSSTAQQNERVACKNGDESGDKFSMRRGYSDQTQSSSRGRRRARQPVGDDSIDYYLEPTELRRIQLSPTLRHSVEYIRSNTTEAGRVVRIYKNGQPFDRPLRICVMRGEFVNMTHLLDHINSRQLIPSGARYLFHLDGQLVYSVEELKHDSIYIVSGTRSFDFKTNNVLKIQREHEKSKQTNPQTKQRYHVSDDLLLDQTRDNSDDLLADDVKPQILSSRVTTVSETKFPKPRISKEPAKVARRLSYKPTEAVTGRSLEIQSKTSLAKAPVKVVTESPTKAAKLNNKRESKYRPIANRNASLIKDGNTMKSSLSKSHENLDEHSALSDVARPKQTPKPVGPLARAKSELSALPHKPKKNVTFVDTGRGSSPAVNLSVSVHSNQPIESTSTNNEKQETLLAQQSQNLQTSEIGIQVSDSIEGFLIDLPLPLGPAQIKNETRTGPLGRRTRNDKSASKVGAKVGTKKAKRRIVTITEQQLSFDEMDRLKDMDHGDHHFEAHKPQHVSIILDSAECIADDTKESKSSELDAEKSQGSKQVEPNEIFSSEKDEVKLEKMDEIVVDTTTKLSKISQSIEAGQAELNAPEVGSGEYWQYPGGRPEIGSGSATPAERPVSQSDANEVIRARVLTPSPSVSTMGDSMTLSYEAAIVPPSSMQRRSSESTNIKRERVVKRTVSVRGKPCHGIQMPTKNFQLAWINGFAINDRYPDNSTVAAMIASSIDSSKSALKSDTRASASSPSTLSSEPPAAGTQFYPSERFHNWIWHSRVHDELVYPAGSLVVLWCHWTHEQRYYSSHTTSVSCLALASLDTDLAASAQVPDPYAGQPSGSCIHLWSLSTLDTLRVVEDDRFRGLCIYSLRLRNTKSEGCELTIGAREEKQLWLFVAFLDLSSELSETSAAEADETPAKQKQTVKTLVANKSFRVLKAKKSLQKSQIPLFILRLSNVRSESNAQLDTTPTKTSQKQQNSLGDVVLGFGRRHFQLWFTDRRRSNLVPLEPTNKTAEYCEIMAKSTCLARMSPTELVVGDKSGNISLILLDSVAKSTNVSADAKISKETRVGKASTVSNLRYDIETIHLHKADSKEPTSAITCLARVSGNLFASADSNSMLNFWRIERSKSAAASGEKPDIKCQQLCRVQLPSIGFVCTFILSRYSRKEPSVEFYLISTSNAILLGCANLPQSGNSSSEQSASNFCTLSVIYEGHETSATSLVADCKHIRRKSTSESANGSYYYTCSLDYKICKWDGRGLVWKSLLPSACASLAVHPVGFVIAIGSADGTVYILDKISGLLISYFPLTPVCINCLAYSSDGSLLAAGCSNGSIFILPVHEQGLKYKKVSIFQSPYPVVSLQFSIDNMYILTSVTHGSYQELILWDLPNFRYMRENVTLAIDKIQWFDSICSGSEDVRAIWENANLKFASEREESTTKTKNQLARATKSTPARLNNISGLSNSNISAPKPTTVVNLSCHRFIQSNSESFAVASDTRGYIRLFRYRCSDIDQGFYEVKVSSLPVNCCRFLAKRDIQSDEETMFVSSSLDGSIGLWRLID